MVSTQGSCSGVRSGCGASREVHEDCWGEAAALARTDGTVPRLTSVITEAPLLYQWGGQKPARCQASPSARSE
jgi:hypothetical protein